MPRPKGSKNKEYTVLPDDVTINATRDRVNPSTIEKIAELTTYDTYVILESYYKDDLAVDVQGAMDAGYQCQGGVSITNYRGNDGNIVFVYAQAMAQNL